MCLCVQLLPGGLETSGQRIVSLILAYLKTFLGLLRFNVFFVQLDFLVFDYQPSVHSRVFSRGGVCGYGCCLY